MRADDLIVLLEIARCGSLVGAASTLGLNHSTVSRRMSALEAELHAPVIVRRVHGCELTDLGRDLLKSCEQIEAALNDVRDLASTEPRERELTGLVRIATTEAFGPDEQIIVRATQERADPAQPAHARLVDLLAAFRGRTHHGLPGKLCVAQGDSWLRKLHRWKWRDVRRTTSAATAGGPNPGRAGLNCSNRPRYGLAVTATATQSPSLGGGPPRLTEDTADSRGVETRTAVRRAAWWNGRWQGRQGCRDDNIQCAAPHRRCATFPFAIGAL
jgi:DNA-binding transcriptional LysR family regulator